MSKIPARTPSNSVKAIAKIGRKATPKHTELYAKSMHITLAGANPAQLQAVAATIHLAAAQHDHVVGGKSARKVTVTCHSGNPFKVFDGVVSPDSVA